LRIMAPQQTREAYSVPDSELKDRDAVESVPTESIVRIIGEPVTPNEASILAAQDELTDATRDLRPRPTRRILRVYSPDTPAVAHSQGIADAARLGSTGAGRVTTMNQNDSMERTTSRSCATSTGLMM